ncbi:ABC transporter substrate-binding protein [Chthonobacter rhizosphaerae]|uniref:ABC transporter substrate-binding protein n=1 Tax=Chthonobacter rhizosphaerae TaxID=2735553 RepID=UPI001FE8759B|nr:sugar ABC transporter substrate-binding protein [Chthonobacter rhizosphaerae]
MTTMSKGILGGVVARGAGLAALLALSLTSVSAATLKVWHHGGRGDGESANVAAQIEAWNKANPDMTAELVQLPEGAYNEQVQAAALAGSLPDLLDFDGPNYANYVWSGYLAPLDGLIDPAVTANLLPSIVSQGTYAPDGKLYAVGQFDSGLALWASKSLLEKAGVRIPTGLADAWTLAEFEDALAKLKAAGVEYPLDLKLNYGKGEWYTYGFSPIVQSFGGDLIDRTTWKAEGTLNSEGSVKALTALQGWVKAGYVVPASAGDDAFYGKKSAAISLVGHWQYGAHTAALGDDLLLLPMPKFGDKAVTGQGSWAWGIPAAGANKEAAGKLLSFLMNDENVLSITKQNGAVPGTKSAAAAADLFKPGGALALYVEQLNAIAVPRPAHPGYPVITAAFAQAVDDVVNGADPKAALDTAAAAIDEDIAANSGYPPFAKE